MFLANPVVVNDAVAFEDAAKTSAKFGHICAARFVNTGFHAWPFIFRYLALQTGTPSAELI